MTHPSAAWDTVRLAELASGHIVLARDATARPVPVPFDVEGARLPQPKQNWRDDMHQLAPADHGRLTRLWWRSVAAPGELKSAGVRLLREGTPVWHRALALNLLDDPQIGVVLLFLRPDPSAAEEDHLDGESMSARRSPWLLQHLTDVGVIRWSAGSTDTLFGRSPEELVGLPISELVHPDDLEVAVPAWLALLEVPGSTCTIRQRLVHPDGSTVWVDSMLVNLLAEPAINAVVSSSVDVSAEANYRKALRASERRFQALTTSVPTGMFACDPSGAFTFGNTAWETQAPGAEFISDAFLRLDRPRFIKEWVALVAGEQPTMSIELRTNDGLRILRVRCQTVRDDDGAVMEVVGTADDVTAELHATEGLRREALRDPLTGLPNRRGLEVEWERLETADATLLFVDLDGFKAVNDRGGHDAGDAVLVEVARRLRVSVGPDDHVARFGGDEFVVLCPGLGDQAAAEQLAVRLRFALSSANLTDTFASTDHWIDGASIGVAVGLASDRLVDLLRLADQRMYVEKTLRQSERVTIG